MQRLFSFTVNPFFSHKKKLKIDICVTEITRFLLDSRWSDEEEWKALFSISYPTEIIYLHHSDMFNMMIFIKFAHIKNCPCTTCKCLNSSLIVCLWLSQLCVCDSKFLSKFKYCTVSFQNYCSVCESEYFIICSWISFRFTVRLFLHTVCIPLVLSGLKKDYTTSKIRLLSIILYIQIHSEC